MVNLFRTCLPIAAFLAFVSVLSVTIAAEETIRPTVVLAVYDDGAVERPADLEARRLVATTIEGRLRADLRYRLSRTTITDDPERYLDEIDTGDGGPAIVLVRLAPRRDGSLRVELDLWRGGEYRWSFEEELPSGDDRFLIVDALAALLSREIAELYPGFGRVRFASTGAQVDYFVYADGAYLGADLYAIELPIGDYEIEIRRRDAEFEYAVGRTTITLQDNDLYELRFELSERPPAVPAFLRLADPEDRWSRLFDITALYSIPMFDVAEGLDLHAATGLATVLFNNVFFRNHILGFQAGFSETWYDEDPLSNELSVTPVMATTGFAIGPVAGVDFVLHAGGGIAATSSEFVYTDGDGDEQQFGDHGFAPAYSATMQYGFAVIRAFRVSLTVNLLGVVEDETVYNWLGFGFGVGARF